MTTPCWLTKDQLEEAQALISLGFCYCGNADDFCIDIHIATVGSWRLYTSPGEIALDAVCNGALYSKCLERLVLRVDFNSEVKAVKDALKKVKADRLAQQPKQLSLFC